MTRDVLDRMRDVVQEDVGHRGLRTEPQRNLITETEGDFRAACHSLAGTSVPALAIVTGFFIPTATPPSAETDGPLGAVFLARTLQPLGFRVAAIADGNCIPALNAGLDSCGLRDTVPVVALPGPAEAARMSADDYRGAVRQSLGDFPLTHWLAIERVGPSHTLESLGGVREPIRREFEAQVPVGSRDRCHSMRGRDITEHTSPAHWLFEQTPGTTTIGIGDGGNEIGMGRIPWEVIRANIPRGGLVACRVPTDHLLVCGVSNWGAYALAASVYALKRITPPADLFDPEVERRILAAMVEHGPLVDGVLGKPTVTVDGLTWEQYAGVLPKLAAELERG
jgi:hypothetical protein